jgi:signal peptidase I
MEVMEQRGIIAEFVNAFPAVLGPRFWPRLRLLVGIVLFLAVVRSVVGDWSTVPSGSMIPTLIDGDRVLVNKLAYDLKLPFTTFELLRWDNPRRGEVIILFSPADGLRLVKRVIGLPGDVLELRNDVLWINGKPSSYSATDFAALGLKAPEDKLEHQLLIETNISFAHAHRIMQTPHAPARRSFAPLIIPPGKYFVMGDNRDQSLDSRYFGLVDRSQIVGQASRILISLGDYCLPRSGRFLRKLDQPAQ